jgi:hypothetical protein
MFSFKRIVPLGESVIISEKCTRRFIFLDKLFEIGNNDNDESYSPLGRPKCEIIVRTAGLYDKISLIVLMEDTIRESSSIPDLDKGTL